ncbi:hypothetical protein A3C05_03405 [Candidatus Giovannonibacteria bacterium RIFCSPHIGHO2_02_FULL_45_40]|uniref:Uncharacterized protein n=1 Tax=Candidatus Giovannonibacteria bacterium RIFCSPHIGHO2_02_FULL_45_40 TaxID=1798337 RepID=A0A1F5WAB4_9BACT|nr:MAG: hypothetical protein A2656_01130 [Candidatus Giovannonibacteria bacterium RIFCSPHIGHO2_01_FULL_44_100]OGF72587.1 MAG: hypothetical protein A3C05_03405 [Candidatus Giovannonibacteria bacterium RIFCSPHIGHO2_02_FULL_45_40]
MTEEIREVITMGAQIAPHFCWIETILETTAENKVLGRILREIKTASPEEIHMFLAEILKISKHWGNPFYGDVGLVSDDLAIPDGTTDIRDEDHDKDEIYHFINGGLHCFIVEVLCCATKTPPLSESIPLLKNYFDYFFNKHRCCTSCAKRVLALIPQDTQIIFLTDRIRKRKTAYLSAVGHSITCMEMSLWLATIAPITEQERSEIMKIIAAYSRNAAEYLRTYSHQRSVRNFLGKPFSE